MVKNYIPNSILKVYVNVLAIMWKGKIKLLFLHIDYLGTSLKQYNTHSLQFVFALLLFLCDFLQNKHLKNSC